MTTQLSLDPDVPGYYSWWASTANFSDGSGAVTWHESEAAAREYAVACFDRSRKSMRPAPVCEVVKIELLLPGPDRGAWRDVPREDRVKHRH